MFDTLSAIGLLLKEYSGPIAAIVIPVVVAYMGHRYTQAQKEKETQSHFVELALQILKAEPTADASSIRSWAIEIVNRYSGVPLDEGARHDLISRSALGGAVAEEVFKNAATIGTQLGVLTQAVLVLAEDQRTAHPAIVELRALAQSIEQVRQHAREGEISKPSRT